MESAIVLTGVRKAFGTTHAVQDLDLTVPRGSLCGVIAPERSPNLATFIRWARAA